MQWPVQQPGQGPGPGQRPGPPVPRPSLGAQPPPPPLGPQPARGTGGPQHARPLWKELKLPYVASLLVLLPLALGVPYWAEASRETDRRWFHPEPQPVAAGETVELAGSEWYVTGYSPNVFGDESDLAGTAAVDVGFHVIPGDDRASGLLENLCQFRAVDEQGRFWEPTTEFSFRDTADLDPGDISFGCRDADFEPIPPGKDQLLIVTFAVPADVVEELRYEVRVATEAEADAPRPAALLFSAEELGAGD
ncbi:hypothetical protein GCM10009642_65800 [Nocardiopsis metallicus]